MLADDATYCNNCTTQQTKRFDGFEIKAPQNSTFLTVLCILTIVGVFFGLVSIVATFTTSLALPFEGFKTLAIINLVISIGKLAAAILMLTKKLIGLYIYTISAALSIAAQIYSVSITSKYMDGVVGDSGSTLAILSTAMGVIIVLIFVILYWLPVNRKLLS
jgi:hypothetical protein